MCGPAVLGKIVNLGYFGEEIVLLRVLHKEVLTDPFLALRPISTKVFWTRVWVASLDMVAFGSSRLVYIGLHRIASSTPFDVVPI